ncbi:hypothetical protein [Oceanobacillus sp. FSL H7-0719]
MKNANWYYAEFDRVEDQIKAASNDNEKAKLETYLDKLHDEFYELSN